MNPSSVLRDPAVYSNPYKFAPDRWFNASDYANRCFVPFGKGARMCQGLEYVIDMIVPLRLDCSLYFVPKLTFLPCFILALHMQRCF